MLPGPSMSGSKKGTKLTASNYCYYKLDCLLASTVKAWVLELNVGFSFYQWNNSSDITALTDSVWTIFSCFLSSPAGRSVYAGRSTSLWKVRSKETTKTLWAQIRALMKSLTFPIWAICLPLPWYLLPVLIFPSHLFWQPAWWHNRCCLLQQVMS